MPKLFLHIGTHKTGTTSIQRFCGANRDALRKRGVWYPPADVGNFPSHYAHHRIAHAIAGRDPEFDASDAADFFDRVRKQMKSDETCLISAEPMYRHVLPDPGERKDGSKPTAAEREAWYQRYVEAVADCIGDFDVTVMVMLRRQDLFLESLYAEQILSTGYTRNIERFATERAALLDYEARLDDWATVFTGDRISVRCYEPATLAMPIERFFVEWLGPKWDDGFQIGPRQNVTPSRAFVEFKRIINTQGQSSPVNNQFRRWIQRLSTTVDADDIPDLGRYYLQPRDRVELLEGFEASNRAVAERYCGGTTMFQEDLVRDLAEYVDRPRLTERDFRNMARLMFRMIAEETTT